LPEIKQAVPASVKQEDTMRIGLMVSLSIPLFVGAVPLDADTLDGALNRLDQAGSQFKGMTANLKYVKYTALVNESSVSTGTVKVKRPNPGLMLALFDFLAPDKKIVAIDDKTVEIYLPNMKTVQEFNISKYKVSPEQFFLFGFGTSRRDLEAAYSVSYGGAEPVNGEPATRLVLIPNSPDVKKHFVKFELWISDKTGEALQQKFYEPSGDYSVYTYSDMKINPNLPDSAVKLPHLKSDVKRETLNK
jgi:outer membrane lipoprotein-sorting protein